MGVRRPCGYRQEAVERLLYLDAVCSPGDRMEWAYATRAGAKRAQDQTVNEDAMWVSEDGAVCVVADGGSWRGQPSRVASAAAIRLAQERYTTRPDPAFIADVIQQLNVELLQHVAAGEPVGTTTISIVHRCRDGRTFCAAVGDSPIYQIRNGGVVEQVRPRRRYDSTVANGRITQVEADAFYAAAPWWVKTRLDLHLPFAMTPLPLAVVELTLRPGDILVLCTDGVSEPFQQFRGIPRDEIARVVAQRSPTAAVAWLLDTARARGSEDDLSCAVGRV